MNKQNETNLATTPVHIEGISLRDWFAGIALAGYMHNGEMHTGVGKESYAMADRMIRAMKSHYNG